MNPKGHYHPEEDQILQAIVDETDLPPTLRDHLRTCSQCRDKRNEIKRDLDQLGRTAKGLSPSFEKRIILPVKETRAAMFAPRWRTAWGAVFACLLIWVLGTFIFYADMPGKRVDIYTEATLGSEQLTDEVNMLSENALPQEYLSMIEESDDEPGEGLLDFLFPETEDETLSLETEQAGGKLC